MFDRFFEATKAQFIARPDAVSGALIHRHPDTTVPRGAKLTVRSDELAVFFREGRAVGSLKAGAYHLDTANIPFLGGLVNMVTGGNHYIAEVFFVRTAETPIEIGCSELGSFVDVNSRNLLRVLFNARVTVSVTDPVALITQLGGQSSTSGAMVDAIVSARLRNALTAHVSREAEQVPIYRIISNSGTETFGQAVVPAVGAEFASLGLKFVRFLDLHISLDDESMELLREYQRREADLTIDAKGAQVAADPGFAQYNAVKGARSVAEGLGSGLGQGFSGPVIGMGLGLPGGVLPGGGIANPTFARAAVAPPSARPPAPAQGVRMPDRYVVEGPAGPEGPYTVRQVALWLLASGRSPDSVRIRQEQDPEDLWSPVSAEPNVMAELNRRRAGASPSSGVGAQGSPFEVAFAQAVANRQVTADELSLLASLALAGRLAASEADARALVSQRAAAAGCSVESPAAAVFAYWNGSAQESQLSAAAVADRIRAGGSTHMVWTPDLGNWVDARTVPAIGSLLLGSAAPPPPPPPPAAPPQA